MKSRTTERFRKALAANPANFTANVEYGVLLKNEQKLDEALEYLGRALQIRPDDLDARYQVGTIYLQQDRLDAARQILERITSEAPAFTAAHRTLATVYYRLKRRSDGDRERSIAEKLTEDTQKQQQKGINVK